MNPFATALLQWFDQHGRHDLPWQQDINPYRVWVSEIMLQQTQVGTVIPYYERFMDKFPDVQSLATADTDTVLHYWTGLGYYARARNLHKAARIVVDDAGGEFPRTVEELIQLPGIGRSTAGAIVAICTNQRATILDGNVKRVLARHDSVAGWPGQTSVANALWSLAEQYTPDERVADYTQAIMDLGATVCIRTNPACDRCPVSNTCRAYQQGSWDQYPGKKPRKKMPVRQTCMLIIQSPTGEYLLEQRPPQGLWGGLWSFPECQPDELDNHIDQYAGATPSKLEPFRHTFTHFHLDITPVFVELSGNTPQVGETRRRWYSPEAPDDIGLTKPVTKLLERLGHG